MIRTISILLCCTGLSACTSSETASTTASENGTDNVLIDYIDTPKSKARGVASKVEGLEAERQRQLKAFDE